MIARILAVAAKEFRQLRRDRLTIGMIFGIPMIQMLLFGYAINFDVRELPAGVYDDARTTLSRNLVAELQATGVIRHTRTAASSTELEQLLDSGDIAVAIHIPHDFERRVARAQPPYAQFIVDGSRPTLESVARGLAQLPMNHRMAMARPAGNFEIRTEYNPERRTAVQIVPALIGVILNMTMMIFTAAAIVRERERGNLELLITTPASGFELMCGKLAPYVLIGLVQTTLVLFLGFWLFAVPIAGSLFAVYLIALLFIAAALTLGLLISTVAQTQMQAFQMSFFVLLPSILLSGFMFPFEGMPRAAQWVAQVLPLTHFNQLIRGVVLRGADWPALLQDAWPLGIFLTLALALATLRFHKRLD